MGLLSNLRVLAGSDIGDQVQELLAEVRRLRAELSDQTDLCELRYRRQNKRDKDARRNGDVQTEVAGGTTDPRVAGVLRRRAMRGAGGPGVMGGA